MPHQPNIMNNFPIVITKDNQRLNIQNIYSNSYAFLILGGPSFSNILNCKNIINFGKYGLTPTEALKYPSHITMGVNNSVKNFRPNLWTSVDEPNRFLKSIWLDPTIQKFIPYEHMNKKLFDSNTWTHSDISVNQCPSVFGIERNERFNAEIFLSEKTFNWGDHKNYGGCRSVMLIAIKLLYYMGIREIFLLGCDFYMDDKYAYHFPQERSKQALNNNNRTYTKMIERFEALKPIFDSVGFKIYNCNHQSKLKTFPFISFEDAMLMVHNKFNIDIMNERVDGLYDREAKLKKGAKLVQKGMKK